MKPGLLAAVALEPAQYWIRRLPRGYAIELMGRRVVIKSDGRRAAAVGG
jgi:hypothetical protein